MQRPSPEFLALVRSWMQHPAEMLLGFVWLAYEDMRASPPKVDGRDLERSITQLLEPRIREAMTGDEPFYVQHGPFERETMKAPPAQPPEYDLAFVFRADERVMWPMEAKVMETSRSLAAYIHDLEYEFLTCRYAPFSGSGAMLGYLLAGNPDDALMAIGEKLGCSLSRIPEHPGRPNRVSRHTRTVPSGKAYPVDFDCFHLILEYPDLSRGVHVAPDADGTPVDGPK